MGQDFMAILAEQRSGEAVRELTEAMRGLVADVVATGKKGSVTLTLELAPASKGNTNAMVLTDTINLKAPKVDAPPTIFFATEDNWLTRRDSRQPDLPNTRPAEVRAFPAAQSE